MPATCFGRLLDFLPLPYNKDPRPLPALGIAYTADPTTSLQVVIQQSSLSLWASGYSAPLVQVDLTTGFAEGTPLTMSNLAVILSSAVSAASPPLPGAFYVAALNPSTATTDRDWSNCPAAMLLDGAVECNVALNPTKVAVIIPRFRVFIITPSANGPALMAYTSPLWNLYKPIALALDMAWNDTAAALSNLELPGATGTWLDYACALYGIYRLAGESDSDLATRALWLLGQPAVNNLAIALALQQGLGSFPQVIDVPGGVSIFRVIFPTLAVNKARAQSIITSTKPAGSTYTLATSLPLLRPQNIGSVLPNLPSRPHLRTSIQATVYRTCTYGQGTVPTTSWSGPARGHPYHPQSYIPLP